MIKGLSEVRRLPRIGVIRLGVKDEKRGFPIATDYFVVKADDSTSHEDAQAFHAIYGDKPKRLNVLLPYNTPEMNFPQFLKLYGGNGLKRKCDGETCNILNEAGEISEDQPCVCQQEITQGVKDKKGNVLTEPQCKQDGRLSVVLPDVIGLGVWQIRTGSFNSIISINSSLDFIYNAHGRLSGIPLVLDIVEKEVQHDGTKKTVHVLEIQSRTSVGELLGRGDSLALAVAPTSLTIQSVDNARPVSDPTTDGHGSDDGTELPPQPGDRQSIPRGIPTQHLQGAGTSPSPVLPKPIPNTSVETDSSGNERRGKSASEAQVNKIKRDWPKVKPNEDLEDYLQEAYHVQKPENLLMKEAHEVIEFLVSVAHDQR